MRTHHRMLGLCLALLLVACTGPAPQELPSATPTLPSSGASLEDPVELVVWAEYWTMETARSDPEGQGRYGRYIVEQFEKEHPGVKVQLEFHGWDEALRQNLFNALLAGTAPDIVVGENFFKPFIAADGLVAIDAQVADIYADLLPGTYQAVLQDGQLYGLPAFTGVFGFERNCEVVEAAGLDCDRPPETWEELLAEARSITAQGKGAYYGYTLQGPVETSVGSALRVGVLMAQSGADICVEDCTRPYFDNPKAIPALEFLREIYRYTPPGLAFNPDEGQVYEQLFRGLSAYQIAGSWHPQWAIETGCEDCRYSPVPYPESGQKANLVVGNVIYAVLKQSQHPDLAVEWLKFLVRDDVQALIYPALGRLPTTRSALEALYPTVDPAMQTFITELLHNPNLTVLPQWQNQPQELWRIYNEMLLQVLTTERPIPELMSEAQQAALGVLGE